MSRTAWTFDAASGELDVITGTAGPAAKMGHRLTIAMRSWQATVQWAAKTPSSVEVIVDVESLQVLRGEGGITPLTAPERAIARSNALKSLDAKKFPSIRFTSATIDTITGGYRLEGTLEIHGISRQQTVDVDDDGQRLSSAVTVRQSDFGVKPYSLMMGALKVADEVTVLFSGARTD
jgi:polyisoprenoid-binding protein YceI